MKKTALFLIASLSALAPLATAASAVEIGVGHRGIYVDSDRDRYDRDCGWHHGYRHCW